MTRMVSEQIVLHGTGGLVEGEKFAIDYGETVIIGRSSSCDISLKKCEKFLLLPAEERESEKHFQTVSRKHARVSFYNSTSIEIEDLSSNGTFLDGEQIKRVIISDIKDKKHELLLGTKEKFMIEWGGAPDAPTLERSGAADRESSAVPEAIPVEDSKEEKPVKQEADVDEKEEREETLKPLAYGDDEDEDSDKDTDTDDDDEDDDEEDDDDDEDDREDDEGEEE